MKISKWIVVAGVIVVLGIAMYSMNSGSPDADYSNGILAEREEKESFMKNSDESPFTQNKNEQKPLHYFAPDPKYRINARLVEIENKKVMVLPTSANEEASYLEYAWAEFNLDGIKNRLLLLEVMAMGPTRGTLFVAFADETSAKETYGGGRYLELKKTPGAASMVLDFNKAYNPYCAYNENFSCPLPPKENILKVEIRAGEKNFH